MPKLDNHSVTFVDKDNITLDVAGYMTQAGKSQIKIHPNGTFYMALIKSNTTSHVIKVFRSLDKGINWVEVLTTAEYKAIPSFDMDFMNNGNIILALGNQLVIGGNWAFSYVIYTDYGQALMEPSTIASITTVDSVSVAVNRETGDVGFAISAIDTTYTNSRNIQTFRYTPNGTLISHVSSARLTKTNISTDKGFTNVQALFIRGQLCVSANYTGRSTASAAIKVATPVFFHPDIKGGAALISSYITDSQANGVYIHDYFPIGSEISHPYVAYSPPEKSGEPYGIVYQTGSYKDTSSAEPVVKFMRSKDLGKTWTTTTITTANVTSYPVIGFDKDESVFVVGHCLRNGEYVPGVFKSMDGGYTWTSKFFPSITTDPNYNIITDRSESYEVLPFIGSYLTSFSNYSKGITLDKRPGFTVRYGLTDLGLLKSNTLTIPLSHQAGETLQTVTVKVK